MTTSTVERTDSDSLEPAKTDQKGVGLSVNPKLFVAEFNGAPLDLTPTEYDLLVELMSSQDRVVAREELHSAVWPHSQSGPRVVDTFVSRLRTKLRSVGHPGIAVTRKRGYRLIEIGSTSEG